MSKELFVKAEEVARELGISKPYAYKLVREMNEELKEKGFRLAALTLSLQTWRSGNGSPTQRNKCLAHSRKCFPIF